MSDCAARRDIMTALYVIFLGIVPFVAIIALIMYYTRRNVKYWWKKSNSHSAPTIQPPSYVTSRFRSSVSGCLGRFSVQKLSKLNFGVGNIFSLQTTQLPHHGMLHSSNVNASKEAVEINLEITKTGLISTTNSYVMNTLQPENDTQNTSISSGFSRGQQKNKGVILIVENLLQPSSSSSGNVPIYKRKEMFMKSNTNKSSNIPQTHIPAKSNISSNINIEKPGPSSSILAKHDPPTSSSNSVLKSDQPRKIRKNSKNLQLKVKHDPIKQKLIKMSDSCPSTPETPPLVKYQNNPITSSPSRPTVAELSSKFEAGSVSKA
ncbi:hypothetical protein B7P43_G12631 [Cryptotermes secundus]|uniref:Uncharacterized protein n=1 Tax=Cryptotermes secundus TaxID=105785 RepID=A0A2J7QKG4_9NEOP|nr:hypothetical protein B7P43_G12631 [Cryptotermes secundus]